ncbi:MBL fold metallo-hydrolase [Massilia glaciei]|uniref:MBL fold metallo-hydrolase n=1 Tax=Massilia glaciei TaxID=1524097 RepID=A0A2U2I5I0_9BURK|nr:MBL fold metallo-hydrolase [Massilia glaciei]PWF55016.1 MBL fold metallo-hydrolase [Massilia glaciei]
MHITQLRNATIIVRVGAYTILVDPMLASRGALPPLRLADGMRRNPVVELPEGADALLDTVTHCLITHCQKGHFDHLDRAGKKWLRERQIPVICTPHDAGHLRKRGLNVQALEANHADGLPFLGGTIRTLRCTHGLGLIGRLMEHGVGYLIDLPGEPSLFLAGDTILTAPLRDFIVLHQPDVSVVPAGGARFDLGAEILMDAAGVIELTRLARGMVVANHLEALSHCPVSREDMNEAARAAGLLPRLRIPRDGETLVFHAHACG